MVFETFFAVFSAIFLAEFAKKLYFRYFDKHAEKTLNNLDGKTKAGLERIEKEVSDLRVAVKEVLEKRDSP